MADKPATTKLSSSLPTNIFGIKVDKQNLLHLSVRAFYANQRQPSARTLKRGEVRGGGKKPWVQKGTGRARAGSIRSPIWRGGGVTFGPTGNENYHLKLTAKSKKLALRQALSLQAQAGAIKVVENFTCPNGKTGEAQKLLAESKATGKTLLIVSVKDDLVKRATNNLPNLKVIQADRLNVVAILTAETVLITKKSLDIIKDNLDAKAPKTKAPEAKVAAGAST